MSANELMSARPPVPGMSTERYAELGITPKSLENWEAFFDFTNLNALATFAVPLTHNLYQLEPYPNDILPIIEEDPEKKLIAQQSALQVAKRYINAKEKELYDPKSTWKEAMGIAINDGNIRLLNEMFAGEANNEERAVIKAIANLHSASNLIAEQERKDGADFDQSRLPEEIRQHVETSAYLLSRLIRNDYGIEMRRSFPENPTASTEPLITTQELSQLLQQVFAVVEQTFPTYDVLDFIHAVKTNTGPEPKAEEVLGAFNSLPPPLIQDVLCEIAATPERYHQLGILLAVSGVPKDKRTVAKNFRGSRQAPGRAKGIVEAIKPNETIAAIRTPEGLRFGIIRPIDGGPPSVRVYDEKGETCQDHYFTAQDAQYKTKDDYPVPSTYKVI